MKPNNLIRAAILCALTTPAAPMISQATTSDKASGMVSEQASDRVSSDATYNFNLPAQPLTNALRQYAQTTNQQIIFTENLVQDKTAPALEGELTPGEALGRLLMGTGLKAEKSPSGALMIQGKETGSKKIRVSQNEGSSGSGSQKGSESTEGVKLEEVIVTATKRAEKLQETSLSITAIGNAEIDRRDLAEMEDYLAFVPGVSFSDSRSVSALRVRGISADQAEISPFSSGPSVAAYFGEVPLTGVAYAGGTPDLRLVDMERVEVLRGPQGTLFGAGSLSGAVRSIPVEPDLSEMGGKVAVGYGNTARNGSDNYKFEGVINLPIITDVLAVRAVGYRHSNSGFVDNIAASSPAFVSNAAFWGVAPSLVADEQSVGETEVTGARLSALWRPTDNLKVSAQFAMQESDEESLDIGTNVSGYTQTLFRYFGIDGILSDREGAENDVDVGNLLVQYDFGIGNLLSSSSWVKTDGVHVNDISSLVGGFPVAQDYDSETESLSEEVRFVSALGGPLQFLVGLYYEDIDRSVLSKAYVLGDINQSIFGAPFGTDTQLILIIPETFSLSQKAGFGELSYDLTERLKLTVGGRWFKYDRSRRQIFLGAFGNTDDTADASESGSNYKANVSFKPDDNTFLYAQWAEGFRFGNTQFPAPANLCDTDNNGILDGTSVANGKGYDSDFLGNFEIGAKLGLLDGKMQLNASAYHMNWDGIPISVVSGTCFFGQIANAGSAFSRGLELEIAYRITPTVQVNLAGSYVNAELDSDAPSLGGKTGDRLPNTPRYNLHTGLEYGFEWVGNPAYIRGEYSYVGGFYNNLQQTGVEIGDYPQLDLFLGVHLNGFGVQLVGRNLTNEDSVTFRGINNIHAAQLRPRTIGINLDYQF